MSSLGIFDKDTKTYKKVADLSKAAAVDDALSKTSTNPVQNKVVTSNLNDIRKETTVNLLNPTLETTTQDGITCTNNGDGTYTLNGTATSVYVVFNLQGFADTLKKHLNEELLLVGCPKNNGSYECYLHLDNGRVNATDDGDGHKFNMSELWTSFAPINIEIRLDVGTTVNNLVFKPMITTNLNATYDDFVPYTGDTGKLNNDVAILAKKAKFERNNSVFSYPGMPDIAITGDVAGRFGAISDEWLDTEGRVIKFKNYKDEKTHISIYAVTPAHSALFLQAYSPNGASVEVKSPLFFYNESDTVEIETISCDVTAPISTTTGIATSIAFNPMVIKNV